MITNGNTVPIKRKRLLHKPHENAIHCQLADLLRLSVCTGWLWWHTPNGELRNKATAGRLKKMGVKPGVSDILLLSPTGVLHALELKRHGKSPTSDQTDFMQAVVDAGGKADWTDNFEDAVAILAEWNAIKGIIL